MANAGQVVTGVVGLGVGILTGNPLLGLSLGLTLGGVLFPPDVETDEPKPAGLQLQTSQYGVPVNILFGTRKFTGNLIWYGNFQQIKHEDPVDAGKGGSSQTTTSWTYTVSMAVGVCAGPADVLNVWDNNKGVPPGKYTIYDGTQSLPDSHLASFVPRAPVWKNLCYIVFEDYDLGASAYIPNFSIEASGNSTTSDASFELDETNSATVTSWTRSDTYGNFLYTVTFQGGDLLFEDINIVTLEKTAFTYSDGDWQSGLEIVADPETGALYVAVYGTDYAGYGYYILTREFAGNSVTPQLIYSPTNFYNYKLQFLEDHKWDFDAAGNSLQYLEWYQWLASVFFKKGGKPFKGPLHNDRKTLTVRCYTGGSLPTGEPDWAFGGYIVIDKLILTKSILDNTAGQSLGKNTMYSPPSGITCVNVQRIRFNNGDTSYAGSDKYTSLVSPGPYPAVEDAEAGGGYWTFDSEISRFRADSNEVDASGEPILTDFVNITATLRNSSSGQADIASFLLGSGSLMLSRQITGADKLPLYFLAASRAGGIFAKSWDGTTAQKIYKFAPDSLELVAKSATVNFPQQAVNFAIDIDRGFLYVISRVTADTVTATKYQMFSLYTLNEYSFSVTGLDAAIPGIEYPTIYPNMHYDSNLKSLYIIFDGADQVVKIGNTSTGITETTPPDVTREILTNEFYGSGLDEATYLDTTIFDATKTYCFSHNLLVSMLFSQQMSILDVLQYIISHHDGFITYYDGKIAHNQLKAETSTGALSSANNDFVQKKGSWPIHISQKGSRAYNNKILVQYTKRDKGYVQGTAIADDMVDIDTYGIRNSTTKLDGLTSFGRASKMANLLLQKQLLNPKSMSFKLGPKNITLKPGEVWDITDSNLEIAAEQVRIMSVGEGADYVMQISALEDKVYEDITYGSDTTLPTTLPGTYTPTGSIVSPMLVEFPALYSGQLCQVGIAYSRPEIDSWSGASLYRAYDAGGSYVKKDSKGISGITGRVIGVGDTNYYKYIDIELDYDDTLTSATDYDDLMTTQKKNLIAVQDFMQGNIFIRFQSADLIAVRQWRLYGLIYNVVNIPKWNTYGDVAVDDMVGFYESAPYVRTISDADKGRTLFYKLPSFNFKGEEQSLADVMPEQITTIGLDDKPLSPTSYKVNSVWVDDDAAITISAGDITIEWMSRNRYNTGGYIYDRTDVIVDDPDFKEFQIEFWKTTTLKRTVNQTGKSFIYTAAMQSTDSIGSAITLKVKQISDLTESEYSTIIMTTV